MLRLHSLTLERPRLFDALCLLLGALLPLAFAPLNLYPLGWFVPGLLMICWNASSVSRVFWRGWLFGCGFFGAGVSWVFVSIHFYGHTSFSLAFLLTLLFVMALGLFPALQAISYRLLFPKLNAWQSCLGFSLIWVLWEWVRGTLFTGFPWLFLGYSQLESPLSGFIPVFGVYGTTFVAVLTGSLMVYAFCMTQRRTLPLLLAGGLLVSGFFFSFISWTTPSNETAKFSLIQGNIPQENKWNKAFIESIIQRYVSLTREHGDSDFVVWPEAALPVPLPNAAPLVNQLGEEAKLHNSTLLIGAIEYAKADTRFYNTVVAAGEGAGSYHKRHLVPFGEYIPFEKQLRNVIQFFNLPSSYTIEGKAKQTPITVKDWRITPLICYEIAYAALAKEAAKEGNIILTVSNDTWFGRSWGPLQHLQIAQFRALETGRYVIRATNSGYTAIINSQGKILESIAPFKTDVLTAEAQMTHGKTPIVTIGHTSVLLFFLFLLVFLLIFQHIRYLTFC